MGSVKGNRKKKKNDISVARSALIKSAIENIIKKDGGRDHDVGIVVRFG